MKKVPVWGPSCLHLETNLQNSLKLFTLKTKNPPIIIRVLQKLRVSQLIQAAADGRVSRYESRWVSPSFCDSLSLPTGRKSSELNLIHWTVSIINKGHLLLSFLFLFMREVRVHSRWWCHTWNSHMVQVTARSHVSAAFSSLSVFIWPLSLCWNKKVFRHQQWTKLSQQKKIHFHFKRNRNLDDFITLSFLHFFFHHRTRVSLWTESFCFRKVGQSEEKVWTLNQIWRFGTFWNLTKRFKLYY